MIIVYFVAGLALLIVGAELLVRGASNLAAALGVPSLIIGLTVVAFGTSAPELAVSVKAAWAGQANIAVGNVVGSNIFNVLFILGLSAMIAPLVVASQLIRIDVPLMVGVSVLFLVLGLDGALSRLDGAILFGCLLTYLGFLLVQSRKEKRLLQEAEAPAAPPGAMGLLRDLALVGIGLGMLVLGSRWLVDSAVSMAQLLGVSDMVIGLTIIAAGTSLPEVVTSIMASIKGERDIAVGNVVGSNIFNLLAVLGVTGIVSPAGIPVSPEALHFDIPFMIVVALACLPIFFTGGLIKRWEGGLLFAYYLAYTSYLVLAAGQSDSADLLRDGLLYFAGPLTAVTLLVLAAQHHLLERRARA